MIKLFESLANDTRAYLSKLTETLRNLRELIHPPFRNFKMIMDLLLTIGKFLLLIGSGLLHIILFTTYTALALSLYLWGEMGYGETLSLKGKFIFWLIALPAILAQWFGLMALGIHFG